MIDLVIKRLFDSLLFAEFYLFAMIKTFVFVIEFKSVWHFIHINIT